VGGDKTVHIADGCMGLARREDTRHHPPYPRRFPRVPFERLGCYGLPWGTMGVNAYGSGPVPLRLMPINEA
jgi:hypothetical protein